MIFRITVRTLLLAILPIFAAALCLAAETVETPRSPEAPKKTQLQVASIHFEGNKIIPASDLKKILTTKEKKFRWFTKAPLDEAAFKEDLERIEKYYLSEGFYHMHLVSHEIEPLVGSNVRIVIRVDEGPPMMVSELDLSIDGPAEWRRDMLKGLPLKAGKRFTVPFYKDSERAALKYLADRGHPKAKVDMRARLDKKTNRGVAAMEIQIGPVCTFGPVRIEGNESVAKEVIKREITFREGERFTGAKIDAVQQRLFNLDLFQFVDIAVENLEDESTALPVRILVKESKKQTVRVGIGYGTEDLVRGQAQYEIRNFLGDGRRFQVSAKASSIVQVLEGRFIQPYFLLPRGSFILEGGILHEDQESFENRKLYLRPMYEYKWSEGKVSYFGYNLEANRLLDVDVTTAARLATDQEHQEHYVSSLIAGNTWEKVDSTLNPHKGWRILQNMEWATAGLGSEDEYFKLTLEGRGYVPTWSYGVFATRLKLGGIEPLGTSTTIPIFKRLFSGGSDSVRGYPYQRLGPLDSEGNPVGGVDLVEGSLEWRFPIRTPFEGVVFCDFGNVTQDFTRFSWDATRYTAGVGLRYLTLVGPLRIDFGYELNPPEQSTFSPYQIHFSIGQAF
ncbi:MAG: BamA/TamA family outer membrane protein [Syntrophobacteraceae bacterium]